MHFCVLSWSVYFCSHNIICVYFIFHLPHDPVMAWLLCFLFHRSLISSQVQGLLGDPSRLLLQKVLGLRTPTPVSLGKGLLGDSPTGESFWLGGQPCMSDPEVSFATAGKDICIANPQTVWKPHYKQCETAASISISSFVLLYRRVSICVCKVWYRHSSKH